MTPVESRNCPDFSPSAENARRWRDLLIEWRKATGRPAIDLHNE